jgi:hypothetical protein
MAVVVREGVVGAELVASDFRQRERATAANARTTVDHLDVRAMVSDRSARAESIGRRGLRL